MAWKYANNHGPRSRHWMFISDGMPFYALEYFRPGVRARTISLYHDDSDVPTTTVENQAALGNIERWPSWGPRLGAERESFRGTAYGWPFVCLWAEYDSMWGPANMSALSTPIGEMPYRPILVPLALNSTLFAAAWALPLFALRTLLRTRRRRHGVCITCGYTLQGLTTPVCPECGAARLPDA